MSSNAARDARIQERINRIAARRQQNNHSSNASKVNEQRQQTLSEQQIRTARNTVFDEKSHSVSKVGEILLNSEFEESNRQVLEEQKQEVGFTAALSLIASLSLLQSRVEIIERELAAAQQQHEELQLKWHSIVQKSTVCLHLVEFSFPLPSDIPQDLYQELSTQFRQSTRLLQAKDNLIKQLQLELKDKDEAYVQLLGLSSFFVHSRGHCLILFHLLFGCCSSTSAGHCTLHSANA